MFSGQIEDVTLEFDRCLIGAVYDKFGEHIQMTASSANKCTATIKVRISPTFWGWLFQFGNLMKITAPEKAISECAQRLKELVDQVL
jgi:hypothetical protein